MHGTAQRCAVRVTLKSNAMMTESKEPRGRRYFYSWLLFLCWQWSKHVHQWGGGAGVSRHNPGEQHQRWTNLTGKTYKVSACGTQVLGEGENLSGAEAPQFAGSPGSTREPHNAVSLCFVPVHRTWTLDLVSDVGWEWEALDCANLQFVLFPQRFIL